MINQNKNVICPKCHKVMGIRQVPYERDTWHNENEIISDMVCRDCRRKVEEMLIKKAGHKPAD